MLGAAMDALVVLFSLERMAFLVLGVIMGLVLGILPGLGGVAGMALLLPFTFGMDPFAAFAFLLGLGAVTSTGDTIPAVLFGVPGTSASQATVIDGHAMAKKGEAGRALAAAYTASLIGGIFGAVVLALTIPVLRPFMLYMGSPQLLACAVFGISMVAVLSGSSPLKGVGIAAIGILLAMVGADPQAGELRWTLDTLYLYDGIPLLPFALGIFALPELIDLAIRRDAIAAGANQDIRKGMMQGVRDALSNKWLVIRCSVLGTLIGAIPGLGSAVVDWFAYGHAARTEKGAGKTFGTGDVRGVLAPESANNAKEGGSLVPTIAFGVPGSASMAILLGAFLIHGLQPGPRMLTENLDVTYVMVWSLAVANIFGAGLCFLLSGQFAKLATLRWTLILPIIITILMVGAYQATRDWGDLYALLFFGVIGWTMKRMRWPRPPLILGFVLGLIIERYMFISTMRYGISWLFDPFVIVLLSMSVIGLFRPLVSEYLRQRRRGQSMKGLAKLSFRAEDIPYVVLLAVLGWALVEAYGFREEAAIAPLIVGSIAVVILSVSFLNQILRRPSDPVEAFAHPAGSGDANDSAPAHMDLQADPEQDVGMALRRAAVFMGWIVAFIGSMAVIGLLPTVPIFIVAYMWTENREPLRLSLPIAAGVSLFVYVVFVELIGIRWPPTLMADWFPELARIIPTM
jgi:TctA family transporter